MKYAVIDTEGSGLFDFTKPADAEGQPRLAELGMILLRDDLTVEEEYRGLVKPDGWTMTEGATAVNGLTTEYLTEHGKPVVEVLQVYSQAIKEGYAIVAFNAQHDCKTMRAELRRAGLPDLFEETKNICVMRQAKGVIPRPDGKKSWPKLEHCRAFLGLSHDGAHGAGADAAAALAVFRYLHSQGVDLTPDVHYATGKAKAALPVEKGGEWTQAAPDTGKFMRIEVDPKSIEDKNPLHIAEPEQPVSRPARAAPLADESIPE